MLKLGYNGWRKRSAALVFSGTDDLDGGRYLTLPTDFLRAYGNQRESALKEPTGRPWGTEIDPDDAWKCQGAYYYVRGEQLWITRLASPPTTLYLEYHYKHPLWSASLTPIDFPMDARELIPAEGANEAKEENWLPGGAEMVQKIERNLLRAQDRARAWARPTKQPRQIKKPFRIGNRY